MTNHLHYGNNLGILREDIKDESIDLIYLDPPFNSQANYNVLFRSPAGVRSPAQIEVFEDTWHWADDAEKAFDEAMKSGNTDVSEMLRAMRSFLKENDIMAYLTMMAIRLLELHRVLKPTGSVYLHCDPTASHYLKLLMDVVFGPVYFRNEIIWKRTSGRKGVSQFGRVHDVILFYSRSKVTTWNPPLVPQTAATVRGHDLMEDEDGTMFRISDLSGAGGPGPSRNFGGRDILPPEGRHWQYDQEGIDQFMEEGRIVFTQKGGPRLRNPLSSLSGIAVHDVWSDIEPINSAAIERTGYQTQKPVALLERIIQASSNEGDVVLDPFCGCGTTIHAAQKLRRQWIGIDVTHLAIGLIEKRLRAAFPGITYEIHRTPTELDGAKDLAMRDKDEFQYWVVNRVGGVPFNNKKKGADTGIDGYIYFKPDGKTTEKAIISVKGGDNIGVAMIRDLGHVVDREKAKIGVFLTLTEPTRPMQVEAVKAGFYESPFSGQVPKLQILTIAELFAGQKPRIPLIDQTVFKKAKREDTTEQAALWKEG